MNVIFLNIQFDNFGSESIEETANTTLDFLTYQSRKYPVSVFRYPDDMILAMPNGV